MSPRSPRRRAFAAALTALIGMLSLAACHGPSNPARRGPSLAPFERMPYLQAVDSASAVVRWRVETPPPEPERFVYRVPADDGWSEADVERPARAGESAAARGDRRVRVGGLHPDTAVEYRITVADTTVGPYRFRTAPRASSRRPVRVLAFGDSGWGSEAQLRLAELMERQAWDLALHVGDLAYDDGTEADFTLRHFWVYRDLLSRVPLFPSPGDHDLRTDGGAPYDRAFEWPADDEGGRYYTFRWGGTRFIALATSDEAPAGLALRRGEGPQLRWLERILKRSLREPSVRWTVVYLHAPIYSSGGGLAGHGSDEELQELLTPLFERYGVDLVLSGHDHHYERTHPVRGGERVAPGCGPVYIVTGGGGASTFLRAVEPSSWTARESSRHHYLRLRITSSGITGEAIDVEGQRLDDFRVWRYDGAAAGLSAAC